MNLPTTPGDYAPYLQMLGRANTLAAFAQGEWGAHSKPGTGASES